MIQPIILSYVQSEALLKAKEQGIDSVHISPDLGLSTVIATLTSDSVVFPNGEYLDWRSIEKIRNSEVNC
ncbi:MAG TPA: spermine synthase, partial [Ktedonobacteraceae bacterium]|nr:spermine synthase [Ktedonobacteraceae bacterium]